MAFCPPLFGRGELLADKNPFLIEEAEGIQPKILDEVLQESGPFCDLFASNFEGVNPTLEKSIVRCRVVAFGEAKQFAHVFKVERRFGIAQVSEDL
jgi:hypothetical protein